jgi:hypothetical protein
MPKKTSTAAGALGDGTPVKVPVSVTTVWAAAVATVAARKSAAKARRALRLKAALLNMETFLSGLESEVCADIVGVIFVAAP